MIYKRKIAAVILAAFVVSQFTSLTAYAAADDLQLAAAETAEAVQAADDATVEQPAASDTTADSTVDATADTSAVTDAVMETAPNADPASEATAVDADAPAEAQPATAVSATGPVSGETPAENDSEPAASEPDGEDTNENVITLSSAQDLIELSNQGADTYQTAQLVITVDEEGSLDLTQVVTVTGDDGAERQLSFCGLGSSGFPFQGSLTVEDGKEVQLLVKHSLFNVLDQSAGVGEGLYLTAAGSMAAPLLANRFTNADSVSQPCNLALAVGLSDSSEESSFSGLVGTLDSGSSLALSVNNRAGLTVVSGSESTGFFCNTLSDNATLSVLAYTGNTIFKVSSSEGAAGALVGTMGAGSCLNIAAGLNVAGKVTGSTNAGGLVGYAAEDAKIMLLADCTVVGSVIAVNGNAGGLIGTGEDTVITATDGKKVTIDGCRVASGINCGVLFGSYVCSRQSVSYDEEAYEVVSATLSMDVDAAEEDLALEEAQQSAMPLQSKALKNAFTFTFTETLYAYNLQQALAQDTAVNATAGSFGVAGNELSEFAAGYGAGSIYLQNGNLLGSTQDLSVDMSEWMQAATRSWTCQIGTDEDGNTALYYCYTLQPGTETTQVDIYSYSGGYYIENWIRGLVGLPEADEALFNSEEKAVIRAVQVEQPAEQTTAVPETLPAEDAALPPVVELPQTSEEVPGENEEVPISRTEGNNNGTTDPPAPEAEPESETVPETPQEGSPEQEAPATEDPPEQGAPATEDPPENKEETPAEAQPEEQASEPEAQSDEAEVTAEDVFEAADAMDAAAEA